MSYRGASLSRRQLMSCLSSRFGLDILILSGADVASISVFKNKASTHLKLVAKLMMMLMLPLAKSQSRWCQNRDSSSMIRPNMTLEYLLKVLFPQLAQNYCNICRH